LATGDSVETDGHGSMQVVSVIDEKRNDLTYNFTVADFHTYYVTKKNVLVHNCNIEPHGNSKASMKEQHMYMIQDSDGNIKKIGISGQPLNKNGTSGRANSQAKGDDVTTVLEKGIKGRSEALIKEGQTVEGLKKAEHRLPEQKRPKIDGY
jgi:uncharacterized Zn ribbon protein